MLTMQYQPEKNEPTFWPEFEPPRGQSSNLGRGRLSLSGLGGLARGYRNVAILLLAEVRLVDVSTHNDDPLWPKDLELEVSIVEDSHELGVV